VRGGCSLIGCYKSGPGETYLPHGVVLVLANKDISPAVVVVGRPGQAHRHQAVQALDLVVVHQVRQEHLPRPMVLLWCREAGSEGMCVCVWGEGVEASYTQGRQRGGVHFCFPQRVDLRLEEEAATSVLLPNGILKEGHTFDICPHRAVSGQHHTDGYRPRATLQQLAYVTA